jgi:imidazolonepropionase-like amidohydrolase
LKNKIKKISKWVLILLLLMLIVVGLSIPYALSYGPEGQIPGIATKRLIIENIDLLDAMDNKLTKNKTIVIENGIIKQVLSTIPEIEKDEYRIDGTGKVLLPGLIDMHVHVLDRSDLLLLLAHGVTTVRVMAGFRQQLEFRKEVEEGIIIGPDMILSTPILNQESEYASSKFHRFLETPKDAKELVNHFHLQGYDQIKVYDGLQKPIFDEIVKQAKALEMPLAGHPSFYISIDDYLAASPQSIEHVEMLYQAPLNYSKDEGVLLRLIEKIKLSEVPVTSTLLSFENLAQLAQGKEHFLKQVNFEFIHPFIEKLERSTINWILSLKEKDVNQWVAKAKYHGVIARQLNNAGVSLLLGSDSGGGFIASGAGTIQEMELLVAYGINAYDVIKSATSNPADTLNIKTGKIATGYRADLIMSESNPAIDIASLNSIISVIKKGVYYDEKAIAQMKQASKKRMDTYALIGWQIIDFIDL